MTDYRVTDKYGTDVQPGDTIKDFRGDDWIFKSVSRGVEYNGTAKVIVIDPLDDDPTWAEHQFYANVFDLNVETL
jgi:hypothetical protein